MKSQSKVLFRMDAGPYIGLGHLQRCLSLAIALKEVGVPSLFLANENESSRERAERFGFSMIALPEQLSWTAEDGQSTIKTAAENGCRVVMVDSHEAEAGYLAQLMNGGLHVIARDDLARFSFPCQLVVNGNADGPDLPYRSSSGDTEFLLGPKFIVLGREYWDAPVRAVSAEVANVLVIVGGADPFDLTPGILDLLDRTPGDFTVTAVVGPYFQNVSEVEAAQLRCQRQVKLVRSPDTVCGLMLEADLAISAGGQALYELARVGCPTVAIRLADNQGGQLKAMAHSGCLLPAGDAEQGDITADVTDAFGSLLSSAEQRASMAVLGQELIDGKGATRVAQAISAV